MKFLSEEQFNKEYKDYRVDKGLDNRLKKQMYKKLKLFVIYLIYLIGFIVALGIINYFFLNVDISIPIIIWFLSIFSTPCFFVFKKIPLCRECNHKMKKMKIFISGYDEYYYVCDKCKLKVKRYFSTG